MKQFAAPAGLQICGVDGQSIAALQPTYTHAAAARGMSDAKQ